MIDLSIQYIAGLFDGEGCISSGIQTDHKYYTTKISLMVCIANRNKEVLLAIHDKFPGKFHMQRGCHKLYWNYTKSYDFLLAVFPYLIIKREETKTALELITAMRRGLEFSTKYKLSKEICSLKKKGFV